MRRQAGLTKKEYESMNVQARRKLRAAYARGVLTHTGADNRSSVAPEEQVVRATVAGRTYVGTRRFVAEKARAAREAAGAEYLRRSSSYARRLDALGVRARDVVPRRHAARGDWGGFSAPSLTGASLENVAGLSPVTLSSTLSRRDSGRRLLGRPVVLEERREALLARSPSQAWLISRHQSIAPGAYEVSRSTPVFDKGQRRYLSLVAGVERLDASFSKRLSGHVTFLDVVGRGAGVARSRLEKAYKREKPRLVKSTNALDLYDNPMVDVNLKRRFLGAGVVASSAVESFATRYRKKPFTSLLEVGAGAGVTLLTRNVKAGSAAGLGVRGLLLGGTALWAGETVTEFKNAPSLVGKGGVIGSAGASLVNFGAGGLLAAGGVKAVGDYRRLVGVRRLQGLAGRPLTERGAVMLREAPGLLGESRVLVKAREFEGAVFRGARVSDALGTRGFRLSKPVFGRSLSLLPEELPERVPYYDAFWSGERQMDVFFNGDERGAGRVRFRARKPLSLRTVTTRGVMESYARPRLDSFEDSTRALKGGGLVVRDEGFVRFSPSEKGGVVVGGRRAVAPDEPFFRRFAADRLFRGWLRDVVVRERPSRVGPSSFSFIGESSPSVRGGVVGEAGGDVVGGRSFLKMARQESVSKRSGGRLGEKPLFIDEVRVRMPEGKARTKPRTSGSVLGDVLRANSFASVRLFALKGVTGGVSKSLMRSGLKSVFKPSFSVGSRYSFSLNQAAMIKPALREQTISKPRTDYEPLFEAPAITAGAILGGGGGTPKEPPLPPAFSLPPLPLPTTNAVQAPLRKGRGYSYAPSLLGISLGLKARKRSKTSFGFDIRGL